MGKNKVVRLILSVGVFFALFSVFTFPLVLNLNRMIPGFFSTDEPFSTLWDSWRIKYSFAHGLDMKSTNFVAFPSGVVLYDTGFMPPIIWLKWLQLLSILFSPVVSYNLQIVSNSLLTFIFMFVLGRYLFNNNYSSFFAAIIFSFSPAVTIRTWQHIGLTYTQWLVLCLVGLFMLHRKINVFNLIFMCIAFILVSSFDWPFLLMSAIAVLLFIFCQVSYRDKKSGFLPDYYGVKFAVAVLFAWFLSLAVLFRQFYPLIKHIFLKSSSFMATHNLPSAWNSYRRPFEDLFVQSARPLSYFLPAAAHPIFGKFTQQFLGSSLYGTSFTEHTLYLGWVPLILAFVAFRKWRRDNKKRLQCQHETNTDNSGQNFHIRFFVLLAVVTWLFSQPPWWQIGAVKIYMPSFFMYKILPMFRAYCRFGIMLMLAVAVLAGFGLDFILGSFKKERAKIALAVLACGLVLFEFWNYPPFKVIDISRVPAVYYWLKANQEEFAVAEYPMDIVGPNELYKLCQITHGKKIINGTIPGTYAHGLAKCIYKLSSRDTPAVLKWMGVKFAIVHRSDYLKTELVTDKEDLDAIPDNPGLKLIRSFPSQECPEQGIRCIQETGPIDVYEVIAQPKALNIKE